MIDFQYLQLSKRPQFKDQTFDLSTPGISLILGHNKKTGSPNGVGKSYFFGELADFLTEDESMGTRQDKVRRGSVKFGVRSGGALYEFERTFSPREVITVFKNGKDLGYRELKEARAFLNKIVPYNEQSVGSFLYMDLANGSHPLITGTTATRKAFFRDFFPQIESLPNVKALVEMEISTVRAASDRDASIEAELSTLGEIRKVKALARKVQELTEERDAFGDRLGKLTEARALRQRLEEFDSEALQEFADLSDEVLKARRKELRAAESSLEAYKEWQQENAEAEEKLKELSEITQASPDQKTAEEILREGEERLKEMRQTLRGIKAKRQDLEDSIEEWTEKLAKARSVKKAASDEQGVCPTCGGEYHDEHLETRIQRASETIRLAKKELAAAEESLKAVDDKTIAAAVKTVERLESSVDTYSTVCQAYQDIKELRKKTATEPDAPTMSAKRIAKAKEKLEADTEGFYAYTEWSKVRAEWAAIPKSIRDQSASNELHERFIRLNEELTESRLKLEEDRRTNARIAELSAEKENLRSQLANKPYLDILNEAFSRKGVEKEMIGMACSMLADQVNKFAKYVFNEDFTFSFELGSNFSVLVHRNYGNKVETSDVRRLSGAEKRLFSLVLVVALLAFIPPKKRPNILILDEPTATMGEDNKAGFVRFLPILNKVIPHLIVITPLQPHDYAHLNPRVFTVVKNGASSTITKGVYAPQNSRVPRRKLG